MPDHAALAARQHLRPISEEAMMVSPISEIVDRLAGAAEAVCRRYLARGHREGAYWIVGNVHNAPGRSLFVRLTDGPTARAGKWSDAATGEHGDLLDLIGIATGSPDVRGQIGEARVFLRDTATPLAKGSEEPGPLRDTSVIAARLWAEAHDPRGTIVEHYLAARGLVLPDGDRVRFHPRCHYRPSRDDRFTEPLVLPAMVAAVRDDLQQVVGLHRTWLHPHRAAKASVDQPRRTLGAIRGHGVRFGEPGEALVAGEGIETVLSVHGHSAGITAVAALSAAHLGTVILPPTVQRLYILQDRDAAGARAAASLAHHAAQQQIETRILLPEQEDFNADLLALGEAAFVAGLRSRFAARDRA